MDDNNKNNETQATEETIENLIKEVDTAETKRKSKLPFIDDNPFIKFQEFMPKVSIKKDKISQKLDRIIRLLNEINSKLSNK